MNFRLKLGAYTAFVEAAMYLIGFAFLFSILSPIVDGSLKELDLLIFILENKVLIQVWNICIYVVFGLALIPLTVAIGEIIKVKTELKTPVIQVLGFVWAGLVIASGMIANVGLTAVAEVFKENQEQALVLWKTIEIIQNGLGGGVEVVGGLWVLLIAVVGINKKIFSKGFNYLGLVVGISGVLTAIPGLQDLGAVFGLTQIIWFVWIGVLLLKSK